MTESTLSDDEWVGNRLDLYWNLAALATFLLVPVDMLTTIYAAFVHGTGAEANWIIVWAIEQGPFVFTGINLVAGMLVVLIFYGLIEHIKQTNSHKRAIARAYEVWVGILIVIGLFVAVNNISYIFTGVPLLTV